MSEINQLLNELEELKKENQIIHEKTIKLNNDIDKLKLPSFFDAPIFCIGCRLCKVCHENNYRCY